MKFSILLVIVLFTATQLRAQEKQTKTAEEKAAARLATLLAPGTGSSSIFASAPKPRNPIWWIENPQAPLPLYQGAPPRFVLPSKPTTAPPHPSEGVPLAQFRSYPSRPSGI